MYDASNIVNNILEETEITTDLMDQLGLIYDFYKQLKDDFTNVYVPEEFIKNNEFLINHIEKCMESLNINLNNSNINIIKTCAINFIKSNNEIIKILENIREYFEKDNY